MDNKIIKINDSEINYYRKIGKFKEGLALVQNKNYLYGYIDKRGNEVIPCIYNSAEDFNNGLAKVSNKDRLYGFIDKEGKIVIPFEYEYASNFNEEISYTIIQGKKYLINKENKRVPLNNYQYIGSISEGLILVNKKGLIGYIDKNGNEVIKPQYKNAFNFKEGLAVVENNEGLYGYIDKTGKEVIPCIYKMAFEFNNGLAEVSNNKDLHGFIDKEGKIVIPLEYYFIHKITNDLFYTIKNCKLVFTCGKGYNLKNDNEIFINKNNEELELKSYSQINKLCEGLCLVKNNFDLYGYADETGKEVIPCKYILAGDFHNGLAYVMDIKGKFGFIDKSGKEVIPYIYDKVEDFSEELAIVKKDNEIYVINTNNEVITSSKGYRTNIRIGNNETVIISRTKKEQNKEKIKLLNNIKEELLLEANELDNEIKKSRKLIKEDK